MVATRGSITVTGISQEEGVTQSGSQAEEILGTLLDDDISDQSKNGSFRSGLK